MNDLLIIDTSSSPIARAGNALPLPRVSIHVRAGVMSDVPFMDALQKLHSKQVGWMPTKTLEGKIALGQVLVAEEEAESDEATEGRSDEGEKKDPSSAFPSVASSLRRSVASPVGYCIGNDRYFKRDDVGIIYQMNVAPGRQRGLVGATLLKAQFERSAYGCKLYCCWCAQDLAANRFWEAMGFMPLAFRSGSASKGPKGSPRTHIFWQRRIRAGDVTTPWWFPSQTSGGSIRQDRLVLPIPPGTHWSDAKPAMLPGEMRSGATGCTQPALSSDASSGHGWSTTRGTGRKSGLRTPHAKLNAVSAGGLRFAAPTPVKEKPKRAPRTKAKNDPQLVAAARELRDRWLEHVNEEAVVTVKAKYDVSRSIEESGSVLQSEEWRRAPSKRLAA